MGIMTISTEARANKMDIYTGQTSQGESRWEWEVSVVPAIWSTRHKREAWWVIESHAIIWKKAAFKERHFSAWNFMLNVFGVLFVSEQYFLYNDNIFYIMVDISLFVIMMDILLAVTSCIVLLLHAEQEPVFLLLSHHLLSKGLEGKKGIQPLLLTPRIPKPVLLKNYPLRMWKRTFDFKSNSTLP